MKIFSQRNSQWKDIQLGWSDKTIGSHGCTITSLAMMLTYIGYNETPKTVNDKLLENNGYANSNLVIWSVIPKIWSRVKSVDRIRSYNDNVAKKNIPLMVEVNGSRIGAELHWVLFVGDQKMADPWTGNFKSSGWYGTPIGMTVMEFDLQSSSETMQEEKMVQLESSKFEELVSKATKYDELNAGKLITKTQHDEQIKSAVSDYKSALYKIARQLDLSNTDDSSIILGKLKEDQERAQKYKLFSENVLLKLGGRLDLNQALGDIESLIAISDDVDRLKKEVQDEKNKYDSKQKQVDESLSSLEIKVDEYIDKGNKLKNLIESTKEKNNENNDKVSFLERISNTLDQIYTSLSK